MKRLVLSIVGAVAMSAGANAAVLDFAADADLNGERAVTNLTLDGVAMTLSATRGALPANAYLDASGGEGPAGLGVCLNLLSGECNPSNDDNVTIDETVTIAFDAGPFDIRTLSFRGEGHVDKNGDAVNTLLIALNGGLAVAYTFAAAVAAAIGGAFLGANSISFAFGGASPDQFYINAISDVPLPAALPLLLAGVAGLGFASRRRKA